MQKCRLNRYLVYPISTSLMKIFKQQDYLTIPRSSKNSTGSLSLPFSHINEKNQIALSPIQKSAGVKVILESSGFLSLSGVYSACQPKISPCQGAPRECKWLAKDFTSFKSGTARGRIGS